MSLINLVSFNILGDERGSLISLEENQNIPFVMKRVYYIFGTDSDTPRGFHAHKELRQMAICVKGQCDITMDDGKSKATVTLDTPNTGLLIDVMQWHVMDKFSSDCVLMVVASDHYDEADYIRNYNDFIKEINFSRNLIEIF